VWQASAILETERRTNRFLLVLDSKLGFATEIEVPV
jgi:hypothetical protein